LVRAGRPAASNGRGLYAKRLGAELAIIDKRRDYERLAKSKCCTVVGDVEGRTSLIIDDMIDTGGHAGKRPKRSKPTARKPCSHQRHTPVTSGGRRIDARGWSRVNNSDFGGMPWSAPAKASIRSTAGPLNTAVCR